MHHYYSQKLHERCSLDLFDGLILAVASICLWDHWLWSYKQKDVKFRPASWVCLCTVFSFANIRLGFVEPESKICETNIRFVIH